MKTTFGAVLNSLMFFVEAGRHQHLAMQNQFICDLSKGQNSFGIVLNIWVAGCLGGGTGKLAANVSGYLCSGGNRITSADILTEAD